MLRFDFCFARYSVVKLENLEGQIFRLKQFGCKMVSKILLSAVYFAMRSDVGILTVPPSRKFAAPIHEAKIYPPTEKTEFCNRIPAKAVNIKAIADLGTITSALGPAAKVIPQAELVRKGEVSAVELEEAVIARAETQEAI